MSYHINAPDYVCKKCNEIYIPYKKDLPCPSCGEPEVSQGESYDFIDNVVTSILINKRQFGTFTPQAWYQGSYSDYLQSICFKILEYLKVNPKRSLLEVLQEQESSEGMREYMYQMISGVKDGYDKQNTFKEWFNQRYIHFLRKLLP